MPTGYTACIEDGATFEKFVLHCACSRFYDCSKLPDEEVSSSDFYSEKLVECEERLKRLESINDKEAEIAARNEYEDGLKYEAEHKNNSVKLKKKYLTMLKKVQAWNPPSDDHIDLKQYMIDQINMSIESDCYAAEPGYVSMFHKPQINGKDWLEIQKEKTLKNIEYYKTEDQKERERVEWKNRWIRLLRKSLEE